MSPRAKVSGVSAGSEKQRCFACGGMFAAAQGPTHEYMLSTPGCWAAYGMLLAREYENPVLFGAAHRLTVDAYALQHPGEASDRRAVQSVWVHFAALYLALEEGAAHSTIPPIMSKLAGRTFPPLDPPRDAFAVTLSDVLAEPQSEHVAATRRWAECAYESWKHLRGPTQDLLRSIRCE